MFHRTRGVGFRRIAARLAMIALFGLSVPAAMAAAPSDSKPNDADQVKGEHATIGAAEDPSNHAHTDNPDAQWYPDAGFGLFIHWGLCSVRSMNISWPMIPGRALAKNALEPDELARVIREEDWNINGKPNEITPDEYWSMARDFNPQKYDPDKWLKSAKEAGFTYAVLTTRHHEGFSLWPSDYDDFNTKNYMGGRDLVKEYVEACRKNGLKVGLYYSPPDWHFDRDYMTFLYHGAYTKNSGLPKLGPDLKPRTTTHTKEETEAHQAAFAKLEKGQIEELLTRYGKIDLIWFDGSPPIPNGRNVITQEEIRKLQPGIVINPRLHGHGDFVTYERNLPNAKPAAGWAEFCDCWTGVWSHTDRPFRSDGFVLGELARSRAWGINFLLGVGPMASGEMCDGVYKNMGVVAEWMKNSGESIRGTKPLPDGESASVPATALASTRYLFAIPKFDGKGLLDANQLPPVDERLTLKTASPPADMKLLSDGKLLESSYVNGTITVKLPANRRTNLVDVVEIELSN